MAWSPNCIDKRCYDYKAIADVTDFVVIMAYDLMSQIFPPKPCIAGPNSAFPSVVDVRIIFLFCFIVVWWWWWWVVVGGGGWVVCE